MKIRTRLQRLEQRRRPRVPVVVRFDRPRGQVDIRTGQPVDADVRVRVVAHLGTREQWEML